jgi:hypothetical protein
MSARRLQRTQILAITALLAHAGYFLVSQPSFTDTDGKLADILRWSHYGSILPRMLLWHVSAGVMSTLIIGLLAVALDRRWGASIILVATAAAFALIPFSGVVVQAATARFLGGIAMICVLSILALTFLQTRRQ